MSRVLSAILDLPQVRARISSLSVEAYEVLTEKGLLNKRSELFRGIIVDKPQKSPRHCTLSQSLFRLLLPLGSSGFVVSMYAPLRLADSVPEPDVMIVRGVTKDFDTKHPETAELVVEIADENAALDWENCALYAEANVPEYWIVLAEEKQIEAYCQPAGGSYQQKRLYLASETLVSESVPGLQVVLADWFI